jgi:hypothetical protein
MNLGVASESVIQNLKVDCVGNVDSVQDVEKIRFRV